MSEWSVFSTTRQPVAATTTSCRRAIRTALYGVAGAMLLGVAGEAMAQEDTLVEIVVTAERRAQSAQDVPLALTTFSEDQVAPAAISGLSDIALKTPSFTMTQFNIAEPQLYLRGIGSTSDSAASDPTVSVFLDEVYLGRPGSAAFDLYDLERIEVLRGPQGPLYGRNVTGGVINIYTKPPAETFEAKAGVTLGNNDLSVLRGYVSGPLTNSVRGKVSISRMDRGGYARNVDNGQELDDAHNFSARGQLVVDASEATSLTLSADFNRDRTNGDCRYTTYLDSSIQGHAFNGAYIPLMLAARTQEGITDPRECGHSWTQFADRDNSGVSLRAVHDAGWAELTSITAYRKNEFEWRQELGGMDAPPALLKVPDNEGEDSWQATQELRLSREMERLSWVVGAFGFRENVDRFARVPQIFSPTSPVNPGVALNRLWKQDARNTSYAAFGQATWEFLPRVSLTLGGRYTRDDKEIDQYYWQNNVVVYDLKNIEKTWSRFTGRASLDWRITDRFMAYATYSEGYKSGVFISQSTLPIPAQTALEPEDARNVELGLRSEWLDGRARFNVTAFDLRVDDLQLFRLVGFLLQMENANAKVRGVEADFAIIPVAGLTLSGTLSRMDPKYVGGTFNGKTLARAEKTHWTLDAKYAAPVRSGELELGASWAHSGQYFMEATNVGVSTVPSVKVLNASVKYAPRGAGWDVSLWGKNLTDELVIRHSIVGAMAGSVQMYQPPRTYGASVNLYFD